MKKIVAIVFLLSFLISCNSEKKKVEENVFYTCSMDPQVMEKKPGKCPICKMELTKVTMDTGHQHGLKLSKEQILLANIKTQIVSEDFIGPHKTLNAEIVTNGNRSSSVASRVNGRIERLYIKNTNEKIKPGTLLYEIYSEELLAGQKEYLIALEKVKLFSDSKQLVDGAKNKLLLWGMNEVQIEALSTSSIVAQRVAVYSSVSGVVTAVNKREGDYVMEGELIFETNDLSSVWVEAQLYANETVDMELNDEVEIIVDGFPGKRWKSKINFASPQLEVKSKIDLIRAEIPNKDGIFKPGMRAQVLLKGNSDKALAVPVNSVLQDSGESIVWIKKKDGSFEKRTVITGIQGDEIIEIKAGIAEGDEVVMSGVYLLNSEYIFRKGLVN